MGGFPGIADTGRFAIGNGNCMDGVGVLVVKYKDVVVATAGRDRETTGLIGVGLQMLLVVEDYDRHLMRTGSELGSNVVVIVIIDDDGFRRSGGWKSRGSKILGFLILVPECGSKGFRKMLGD